MDYFDLVYLATIPIYLLSVHFLFRDECQVLEHSIVMKNYIIFGIALFGSYLFINIPIITFLVNIAFYYKISAYYKRNLVERYTSLLQISAIMLAVETSFGLLVGYVEITLLENNDFDSVLGLVVLRIALCTISFPLYRLKRDNTEKKPVPDNYYLIFSCIIIGILFLYLLAVTRPNLSEVLSLFCSITVLLVVFLLFYLEEKCRNMYLYYTENAILKEQSTALENQQELIKQSLYSTKALRHDMKNQILVLHSFIERCDYEHIASHSQFMLENIERTKTLASSGHFVIDSLINYKLSACENITRNVSLQVTEDLPLLAYDLTVILGNLIDNAMTAVNQARKEKIINLLLDCDKGNFVLVVENSYQGKVHYEHGRYYSTKPFSGNHGYGLANVEKAVKKYRGSMEIEHGSNRFTVTVVIPI